MPTAQDASAYVYQGLWTNWDKGKVLGITLTLSSTNSIILIAVIAIFVQLIGSQIWKLSQLALHQIRATTHPRDGLYHQQQVILRNGANDLTTVWQLSRIAIAWRHQALTKSYTRSFGLIMWGFFHFAFFTVAGVFSSTFIRNGDQVLSRSPYCGTWNATYVEALLSPSAVTLNPLAVEYNSNIQTRLEQSQQYVEFCTNPSAACDQLPRRELSWNSTVTRMCPFNETVCSPVNENTITFDTGLLSSHSDFGINAPAADRIFFRKVTACTTLNDAQYISDWQDLPASATSPAKRVVNAFYGARTSMNQSATYSYSDWTQYYLYDQYAETTPYQLNVQIAAAGAPEPEYSDFVPIPELTRNDADLTLVFLSFSKSYESAVTDPWFSAQIASVDPIIAGTQLNGTYYLRQRPVSTLGCTEQYQVCIESLRNGTASGGIECSDLEGSLGIQMVGVNNTLNMNIRQITTFLRILQSSDDSCFYKMLRFLNQRDPPLLARSLIQDFVGLSLPEDQWLKETQYWHSIAMANFQRRVIEYGTGQFAASTDYINATAASHEAKWLCQNQIIRGTPYSSFNFLALMLILCGGFVIIITGLTIEDFMALTRQKSSYRKGGRGSHKQYMWVKNDILELLRLYFEESAGTIWSRSANGIPVAAPGQMMQITPSLDSTSSSEPHSLHGNNLYHGPIQIFGHAKQNSASTSDENITNMSQGMKFQSTFESEEVIGNDHGQEWHELYPTSTTALPGPGQRKVRKHADLRDQYLADSTEDVTAYRPSLFHAGTYNTIR